MYAIFEKLCKEKGVSAYRVSKDTGISTATLSDWKTGKSHPKADKIQILANYFNVNAEYIQNGDENSQQAGWYTDPATVQAAQEIFDDPDLHALFDAARDSKPDALKAAAALLKVYKEASND